MENNKNKTVNEILDAYLNGENSAITPQEHRMQLRFENIKNKTNLGDGIAKALEAGGVKLNRVVHATQGPVSEVELTPLELSRLRAIAETKSKALAYARAELTHATQGPASEADAAARLAICMACEHRAVTYKEQTDENGVGWCTKCGCSNNPRAKLTVKVTLAGVECPLAKWGKVEGTGATVASAVDAVAGVAKSIIHKLSGG